MSPKLRVRSAKLRKERIATSKIEREIRADLIVDFEDLIDEFDHRKRILIGEFFDDWMENALNPTNTSIYWISNHV